MINNSDVFKFVALRPPVLINKENIEINFIKDYRDSKKTLGVKPKKKLGIKKGDEIPDDANLIALNQSKSEYTEITEDPILTEIYTFASSILKEGFSNDDLKNNISRILDSDIVVYLDNEKIKLNSLWDNYYFLLNQTIPSTQNVDLITRELRVFHLLSYISKVGIKDYDTLHNVISATPIVPEVFANFPKRKNKKESPKEINPDLNKINDYKKIWNELLDTHNAIDQVKNLRISSKVYSETKDVTIPNIQTGVESKLKLTTFKSNLGIDKISFADLNINTKSILKSIGFNEEFQLNEAIELLSSKLSKIYTLANNINDIEFFKNMPESAKYHNGISQIVNKYGVEQNLVNFSSSPNEILRSIRPLGIGDLKVVKQKLKKYVAGEVAHIENVLRGEYKERKHRTLDRTEDIFSISNEVEEETTKDTQTTERFELKKESEKTIEEKMSMQAGFTVSGSYGMVTLGAYGDFAYSTSSQESNKSSSNFAREVIDKSVSKIQKKTKEERTTKKLHEVEEINTHGIDNKEKLDHAVGVYRWVDKYYEAQIYNYGKRMMLEFIIPEPAAFFEYAQLHKPKKNIVAPKPLDPNFTHKQITENNYESYIRDYNVQGATTAPPLFKTISTSILKDAMAVSIRDEEEKDRVKENPNFALNNKEMVVPAGYVAKFGVWWDLSAIWTAWPKMEVTIGNKIFRIHDFDRIPNVFDERFLTANNTGRDDIPFHWFYPGTVIQVSVNVSDVLSYTINLYALVERLPETYEQWQIQMFEKIMAAYQAMQAEYEQKVAAQEVQDGIVISGQNPRINREIEKTELKKQCIKMLMNPSLFGLFDAMKEGVNNSFPDLDILDSINEGKMIQFFEQAFEWENLTYLFYSYFWARQDQWIHKLNIYDNDPLFTDFLKAGSARVLIPVRPTYNDVISYYMLTGGEIWGKDGNPPLILKNDGSLNDLFISIADELRNQTDDLANATAEGEPWEVVLPTTLVYLQKDSELPTFNS